MPWGASIARLLSRAYRAEVKAEHLMGGLATVASAMNANDRCLARIAAVHLKIPDLPDQAARDAMEVADSLIKSIDWNPDLHPRAGTPPNPGWFATPEGSSDELASARTAESAKSADIRLAASPWWDFFFGRRESGIFTEGAHSDRGGIEPGRVPEVDEPEPLRVAPKPPRVEPKPQGEAKSLESILAPGGELVGVVKGGAKEWARTVSPTEFETIRSELLSDAIRIETPESYLGDVFELPDGSRIGIRNSPQSGITIDVMKSNSPIIKNGFKVHQR